MWYLDMSLISGLYVYLQAQRTIYKRSLLLFELKINSILIEWVTSLQATLGRC